MVNNNQCLIGRTINVCWPESYHYPPGFGRVMRSWRHNKNNEAESSSSRNLALSFHTHLKHFNEMIVECEVWALLPNYKEQFEFVVSSYNALLDMHLVQFENGETEMLKLSLQEYQLARPLPCPTPKDIVYPITQKPSMEKKKREGSPNQEHRASVSDLSQAYDHPQRSCKRKISDPSVDIVDNAKNKEKKRRKQDVGWDHGQLVFDKHTSWIQCKYCAKKWKGESITRLKQHIAGGYSDVKRCYECPQAIINEMKEHLNSKKEKSVTNHSKLKDDEEQSPKHTAPTPNPVTLASERSNETVTINGYDVKVSSAPIIEEIFREYGDIAKDCIFKSKSMLTSLLEVVCDVASNMQACFYSDTLLLNRETIEKEIEDLKAANIDVSWLYQHLSELNQVADKRLE